MIRGKFFVIILVYMLFLVFASIPRAYSQTTNVTAIIFPEKDVYIVPDDNNYNQEDDIFVGREGGIAYRSLLYFNISNIPSGALVQQAKLYLYIESISFKEDIELRVMALTADWKEDEATWFRRTKTQRWSRKGGDFTSEIYATYTLKKSLKAGDIICIDLTDLVRKWKKKEIENYGIIILIPPPDEAGPNPGLVKFYSREAYHFWQAPRLHVSYTRLIPPNWNIIPHPFKPNIHIPVPVGGFRLVLENDILEVRQGSFNSTILKIVSITTPTVDLHAISPHPGIKVSFNTTVITPSSSAEVTVTVDSTVPEGSYKIPIEGYDSSSGKSDVVELTVEVKAAEGPTPSFTLTFDKKRLSIVGGGSGTFSIYVNPIGSYTHTVSITASSPIPEITVTLSPSSGVPPFISSVVVNVASTAASGTYTIDIVASGADGTVVTDSVEVVVRAAAPSACSSITLTLTPNLVVLDSKSAKPVTVKADVYGIGACEVKLSLDKVPYGVKYTISPSKCKAPCSFTIELTPEPSAPPGKYQVIVRVEDLSGAISDEEYLNLGIKGTVSKFNFDISVSPSDIKMYIGETATATVTLSLLTGSPQSVTLNVEQCPPDCTCSIIPSTAIPPSVATLTINAGSTKGTYKVVVKASRGNIVKTAEVQVTIEEKTCFIATATYGSEVAEEVQFLRNFRDKMVLSTYAGRSFYKVFNAFYYSWSPYVARFIADNPWIKTLVRILLYPLLFSLKIASAIGIIIFAVNPEVAIIAAGSVASALIGLFYLTPIILLVLRKYKLSKNLLMLMFIIVIASLVWTALAEVFSLTPLMMLATTMLVLGIAFSASLLVKKLLDSFIFHILF